MEAKIWYSDLVAYIDAAGGYINKSLSLEENVPDARAIYANNNISRGSLLIHLPVSLALSGESYPSQFEFESSRRNASNWLRCITALIVEFLQKKDSKYVASLPRHYETLLHQSSWPDEDVKKYLSGTTIGKMVTEDRKSSTLKARFEKSVKPFLIANKVIDATDDDGESKLFTMFEVACACVSTRGFHLKVDDENSYDSGPFLLPYIDLLNHTSTPTEKCTTLQRRTARSLSNEDEALVQDGFCMIAERDIMEGEEIRHSYGSLTSGQQLQTFGFVEDNLVQRALVRSFDKYVTPAVLSMSSIISSCAHISSSKLPQKLERMILIDPQLQDFDFWSLPQACDLEDRNSEEVRKLIPDNLVINFREQLSDELITLCCVQFLPNDAYAEICTGEEDDDDKDEKALSLLSADILDDFFLGSLVVHAINHAVDEKLSQYSAMEVPAKFHYEFPTCQDTDDETEDDRRMLEFLQKEKKTDKSDQSDLSTKMLNHAIYGLTIRIEEKTCLLQLREECNTILRSFENESDEDNTDQSCKRIKL